MPELPEVETVRAGLTCLEGATIRGVECRRDTLRYALPRQFADRLIGRRLEKVERVAKYLLLRFADQGYALVHLGMTGQCLVHDRLVNVPEKHDHIMVHWQDDTAKSWQLVYRDPRRFGYWDLLDDPQQYPALTRMGREAIFTAGTAAFARQRGVADGAYLSRALACSHQAIKQLLLDQRVIAGLGNIYALEALWQAGIHPFSRASAVPKAKIDALCAAITVILQRAIEAGGSSLRDFVNSQGASGYFQHQWSVYQRENQPCTLCHGTIISQAQGGRRSFFCVTHQQLFC